MRAFKGLFIFYLLLFSPLYIFYHSLKGVSNGIFVSLWALYLFVYRPIICNLRLLANEKITLREAILNFIPFRVDKYSEFIFFNISAKRSKKN